MSASRRSMAAPALGCVLQACPRLGDWSDRSLPEWTARRAPGLVQHRAGARSRPAPLRPTDTGRAARTRPAPFGGVMGAGVPERPRSRATTRALVADAASPPADTVVPSPGCGRGGRPAGGVVTVDGDHIFTFPPSYDGETPMPVVFGFHANSNPIDQIRDLTRGVRSRTTT